MHTVKQKRIARIFTAAMLTSILIGVHNGRIALWQDEDPEPFKVFPYPVSMLPDKQEQMVRNGVRVESMEELQRMLEAYLS